MKRLLRRWWLILTLAVIGGTVSLWMSREAEPVHRATTSLLVGDLTGSRSSKGQLGARVSIAATFADLIRSRDVLAPVIAELSLPTTPSDLKDRVHVDLGMQETPIISVAVLASSPKEAEAIATSIGEHAMALEAPNPLITRDDPGVASPRFHMLETEIARQEARVARLERSMLAARTPRARARLGSRYERQARLLMDMDASYLAVLHPVGREPSGSLWVLQPAIAEPSRLRPNTQANTGLGVGIGAILGIIIVFGLAMAGDARARRAGRQAPDQPIADRRPSARRRRAVDPWIVELDDP